MRAWQKYWLVFVVFFFSLHLVRDVFQDLKIHTLLSDMLVKSDFSKTPSWYWKVFNTYAIEVSEIALVRYSLWKNKFYISGYLTIFIALTFFIAWTFYWIFL